MKEVKFLCDNSSDIIEPNYQNIYNIKPTVIVDAIPLSDNNGEIKYIEEEMYYQKLENDKQKVIEMLKKIEENNPLNIQEKDENISKKPQEKNNDSIIVDFYSAPTKRKIHKSSLSLKKVACMVGIAIGITAAIKTATKYHINKSFAIANEENRKQYKKEKLQIKKLNVLKEKNIYYNHLKKITLKDEFQLEDVNFYYNSTNPNVKSKKIKCDSYKIRYIAIVSKDCKNVLDVIKITSKNNQMSIDEFMSYYKSLYGNDIRFQINVDGIINDKIIYKNIGWTSIKNIKMKKIKIAKIKTLTLI